MQTGWRPVTPLDPLSLPSSPSYPAVGQKMEEKRAGGGSPPRTRGNRITAVGNDLYSADSRGFLNPFLSGSQGVRVFFHRALRRHPRPRFAKVPLPPADRLHRPPTLSHPLSLYFSPGRLPLLPIRRETCVQVPRALQRFRETEIALSRKSCPHLFLAPRVTVCVSRARRRVFRAMSGNIDTRYSYLAVKRRTSDHAIRYLEEIDTS